MTSSREDEVELHALINGKSSFELEEDVHPHDEDVFELEDPLHNGLGRPTRSERWTKFFVLALACTFSIGSHYAQDCIGPLKDILKQDLLISDSQISLILGSNLVANTVVPIIAGVLVARFGTLKSSLFATGVLFLGQAINLLALCLGSVHGMIFGLCLFGYLQAHWLTDDSSGISPLSLIQETLVVQVFEGESMGLAVALGLVVGKATSFIASFSTVPLALYTPLSYRTPFIVSTSLTLFSVILNIVFVISFSRPSATGTLNKAEAHIRAHKTVSMKDIYAMSSLFWFYLILCILAGAVWIPFVQLSATIVKHRFQLQDEQAAQYASIILFLPILLYPLAGWITDRFGRRLSLCNLLGWAANLVLFCSLSSLACYILLLVPTEIVRTPLVAIACFAFGYGPAPLLLVIIAPFLTEHISTALGLHKALEMAGSTLMQTVYPKDAN
jgi:MFS family permease